MSVSIDQLHEINSFFESYAASIEHFDAKSMANHYGLPCGFLDNDQSSVFTDITKLEGFFNQALVFYKQFGIGHARPEVWSKRVWTKRIVKAKVNWQFFDADNRAIYDCDYHYIIRLDKKDNWKIEMAVSVNEKQKMEEWQKKSSLTYSLQ